VFLRKALKKTGFKFRNCKSKFLMGRDYSSPDIIRQIKWAGHVACMGERTDVYRILMGKPEGKRPLPRRRWEYGIKMDLRGIGWGGGGGEWIHLAQDGDRWWAVVNAVMNLRVLVPRS
jgi:hypothetical protein